MIGLLATLVSLMIGSCYGALASLMGGKRGEALMRCVDILYSLPFILIVILFVTYRGQSLVNLFLALGVVSWLGTARLVYGLVRVLRESDFVAAARLAGASPLRIVGRHILPNVSGPLIAQATITVPGMMMEEAFLSFIGLGVQAPRASWGSLIQEGAQGMEVFPLMLVFPAVALILTLLPAYILGDELQARLDPRRQR
jgi:oligopeptide transport system permease protein